MTLKTTMIFMALFTAVFAAQAGAGQTAVLKTQKELDSYAVGVNIERNFKEEGVDIDLDVLVRGMKDAAAGGGLLMADDDLLRTLKTLASVVQEKQARDWRKAAQDNKKKGEAFLAENKTKEGVVTLPSGLQYKVLRTGSGRKPTDADTVDCEYRGILIDGTEFGTSARAGGAVALKVSTLIPGWREAVKLMPSGSKWRLFVPSELAYGERGFGGGIGPNETLIFDVVLVDVKG